jgi:hypothetical protein
MSELEEVKASIKRAEADIEWAKSLGNIELVLEYAGILKLLLEKEKRLTAGKETFFRPRKS